MSSPIVDRGARTSRDNILFLKNIEKILRSKKIVSAAVEAERLVLHFASADRLNFFTGKKTLSDVQKTRINQALKKRLSGVPLAYLTGIAGFYGHDFYVNRHTLIPRPETELLVEKTLEILNKNAQILEIGTGSGCIAVSLTIQRPDCRMTALDLSPEALKMARKNALFHQVQGRILFRQSDLFGSLGIEKKAFWDIIVSNPPYVPTHELRSLQREVRREPRMALDGGARGLEIIQKILDGAPYYLKEGGFLLLEIGKGQSRLLKRIIAEMTVYKDSKFIKDYAGIDRILIVRKK